ncbi:flagellar basal body P-ring formation chaperone FlgA [Undibacterium sp. SXout20W]|uniref:flagellar basal body P-ring formation chaperone FlgA n=1 Tax=Undibacterium sp. SXout20W TaxID=3413051 RepID=UPI003BF2C5ED
MNYFPKFVFIAIGLMLLARQSNAVDIANNNEDRDKIKQVATEFLQQMSTAQPGDAEISVSPLDSRLNLASCQALMPFLPTGSKAWGKTTVGVRCTAPTAWTVYLRANVQITAEYYVAAHSLTKGQVLAIDDLSKIKGEISNFPVGFISNPDQAIGKAIQNSVSSGTLLRVDSLKSPAVVQQGQTVRVISIGNGFQVATDAQAMTNASEGQIAKARTANGVTLSGVAKSGGIIEISN